MPTTTCPSCGRSLDEHERSIRYQLPDPLLELPDREQTEGTWMTGPTPNDSVMMLVPNVGGYVRALLPVRLTGGYSVTFGVWVSLSPDDLRRTFEIWWKPEYADLRLDGCLANALRPWGHLAAPVELRARNPDETPYCVASGDPGLHRVLTEEWEHAPVLEALP